MTDKRPRTTRRKNTPPDEKTRAIDILRPAVLDLVAVMDRVKNLAGENLTFAELMDLLDGIGKSSTRLATLLKTELQLADSSQASKDFDEAVADLFGHRAIFQPEGSGGAPAQDDPEPP